MNVNIEEADLDTLKKLLCKWFGIGCPSSPTGPTPTPTGPTAPTGPTPTPTPSRSLLYGYYAGGVVPEFADHCNLLFVGSWGDWQSIQGRINITTQFITQMQAARANGINRVMIVLDWCLFMSPTPPLQLLPMQTRQTLLIKFFDDLRAAGVIDLVHAIYTVDEPDVNGISNEDMNTANAAVREITVHYPELAGKPLVVVYGVNGTPGLYSFDWAGFDNYGTPIFTNGEYDQFVAKLNANQKVIIVPGGSNPWQDNPAPFMAKAQADPRVALIMPFMWFDANPGGTGGIRDNGMAPAYRAVGTAIKVGNP